MTAAEIIKQEIAHIVTDHSGGIKFLELLVSLKTNLPQYNLDPDVVEGFINEMPEVSILRYTWHTMNREKMFIYTP